LLMAGGAGQVNSLPLFENSLQQASGRLKPKSWA